MNSNISLFDVYVMVTWTINIHCICSFPRLPSSLHRALTDNTLPIVSSAGSFQLPNQGADWARELTEALCEIVEKSKLPNKLELEAFEHKLKHSARWGACLISSIY